MAQLPVERAIQRQWLEKLQAVENERDRLRERCRKLTEALRNAQTMCSCTPRQRESGHLLECPATYIQLILFELGEL